MNFCEKKLALLRVTFLNARELRELVHRTWNQTNGTPVRAGGLEKHTHTKKR